MPSAQIVCPECNAPQPLDNEYCDRCGASLESEGVARDAGQASDADQRRKPNSLLGIAVIMLVANFLLACGLGVVFLIERRANPQQPEDATETKANLQQPEGTPTIGGRIAFASLRGNWDIYVMNADGSGLIRVTNHQGGDWHPSWSPDGQYIAFEANRKGNYEIYITRTDGSEEINLTNNPASDQEPDWSPDGEQIAFASDREETNPDDCYPNCNFEIYVMTARGGGVTRLTEHPASDIAPSWSPDSSRIAFESDRSGNWDIYVMNADGSGIVNITRNSAFDGAPSWSSDGKRIAFQSDRNGNSEIYVMDANGGNVICLTNHPASDWYPSWSPDGMHIAFESNRNGNPDIWIMNGDGTGAFRVADLSAYDSQPSWSH